MNYFAHGYQYPDRPYFLAGTAVPDWLNVVDRGVKVRKKAALSFIDDVDPQVAELAQGIVRHHDDDAWFHALPSFNRLNWQFSKELRDLLPSFSGLQLHFLGHILVEILLDASLIEQRPSRLDEYYAAVRLLDARVIEAALNRMSNRLISGLPYWIERFIEERFLADYLDDRQLLRRLNQVMKRVRLDQIPDEILPWFGSARAAVAENVGELLPE